MRRPAAAPSPPQPSPASVGLRLLLPDGEWRRRRSCEELYSKCRHRAPARDGSTRTLSNSSSPSTRSGILVGSSVIWGTLLAGASDCFCFILFFFVESSSVHYTMIVGLVGIYYRQSTSVNSDNQTPYYPLIGDHPRRHGRVCGQVLRAREHSIRRRHLEGVRPAARAVSLQVAEHRVSEQDLPSQH